MSASDEYHVPTTRANREETAVLLVGTAEEYGIPQSDIRAVFDGFLISERLALLVYNDEDEDGEPDEPAKKTSGNRAAKKNSEEE